MSIDKVIQEMRWWESRDYPLLGAWADTIEAARTQPVGEVGYAWREASTSQGTHYGVPFVLLSETPVSAGTKLFALPPDVEASMRDKDEELDFLRSVKESRGKELDEKDAEIERLNDFVSGMKGIANTQAEIIAEQNEEKERLWEVITEANEAMRDGSDSTAWAILVAALEGKEDV